MIETTPHAGYNIEIDVFEGPLDLLLHLVRKHELDVFDIPISFVTSKYLEYLDLMKALNLDVAGEYLLMAATLAHIKSRMLLPMPETDDEEGESEDEIDPRQELVRRLLEYQKYKDAAEKLGDRPVTGRNVWLRGAPREEVVGGDIEVDKPAPLAEFPVLKLVEALDRVLRQAKVRLSHTVSVDRLSVSECINTLADRLEKEGEFSFRSCFRFLREEVTAADARHEAVVTFLAILEMAKLGMLRVSQPEVSEDADEEIIIARNTDDVRGLAATAAEQAASDDDYR